MAQLRAGNTIGADRASSNLERDYIVQDGDILFRGPARWSACCGLAVRER
ncbi:hypothetical protein B1B_19015 [mine drainage metagenome]|uniref:Uncharacterized protein n=1 Tax=mine drainage metagenome TaxID=410659 RepID=T0Y436_9ZZZZ